MYPLVKELAADGIPVVVACRVLKLARQPYYRWLAHPISDRELADAYLANAIFDAHNDDPEFGYRLLADEVREAGLTRCDRTVWRICAANRWWSAFGKKRGNNGKKPGPPAHDDLVKRQFSAEKPNQLWLTDITEHRTDQGKLYLCAIKDEWSNRIVGYSISDRMKSKLAVDALTMAVARRSQVAGCIVHSDRGSQFRSRRFLAALRHHQTRRIDGPGRLGRRQRSHGILSSRCSKRTSSTGTAGPPDKSSGSRSSPGSNAPTTAADANPVSAD